MVGELNTPRTKIFAELVVIVPTYREVDNLPELTRRIHDAVNGAGISAEIIVVDDNSQDGTDKVCKELSVDYPMRLITRFSNRGLSSAVIHGIRESRSAYVLVMDADLSHPPEDIPRFLQHLREGADFVVGSRYVEGGATDATWGVFRWLNSQVATLLARGLTDIKDPMAGFFAFPRRILEAAPPLMPLGYKIGLEILVKGNCQRVIEIPITFLDRTRGESKLTFQQQLYYLQHLWRLYQFRFPWMAKHLVKYFVIGATASAIDVALFMVLFNVAHTTPLMAHSISVPTSVLFSFTLNARHNFHTVDHIVWRLTSFAIVATIGYAAGYGIIELCRSIGLGANFGKILSLPVVFVLQYFLNSRITFKKTSVVDSDSAGVAE
ncbi:MAG: glycosyltransferase family 2 protein [Nitrospira sp.]|nr:MAG: glycosyltransferase family 2 protein [Nitrospira sp.]